MHLSAVSKAIKSMTDADADNAAASIRCVDALGDYSIVPATSGQFSPVCCVILQYILSTCLGVCPRPLASSSWPKLTNLPSTLTLSSPA